jgi:hypothetical protein
MTREKEVILRALDANNNEEIKFASAADNGFIQLDSLSDSAQEAYAILRTSPQELEKLLVVHRNERKIKLLHPPPQRTYIEIGIFGNRSEPPLLTFQRTIVAHLFLRARQLWFTLKMADKEEAQLFVVAELDRIYEIQLLVASRTSIVGFFNHVKRKSFMLLLLHVFPRLLMTVMAPDFIHPPSLIEHPDWNWYEFLHGEEGVRKLNGTLAETFTEIPNDLLMLHWRRNILGTFYGFSLENARVLATIFCSPEIMVQHTEENIVRVYRLRLDDDYPLNNPYRCRATTFRVFPSAEIKPRILTEADITFLMLRVKQALFDRTYVNYEFYCRALLDMMQQHSGQPTPLVEILPHTIIVSSNGPLTTFPCMDETTARYLANIFCTTQIIAHYTFHHLRLYSQLTATIRPGLTELRYFEVSTTFRYAASATETFRTMTDKELQYLKDLRWKARKPALLLAARIRHGYHFHIFKQIAHFF